MTENGVYQTPTGFLLIRLAVIVFLVGAVAISIAVVKRYGVPTIDQLVPTDSTPHTEDALEVDTSILSPDFTVAQSLHEDATHLDTQLFAPLRSYYATRDERLRSVTVEESDDETHTARVTIVLINTANETQEIVFFFDKTENEVRGGWPMWTLSHYDNI